MKVKWQNELRSLQQLSYGFIKIRFHKLIQIKGKKKICCRSRNQLCSLKKKKSMFKNIHFLHSKSFYQKAPNHIHQCLWFLLKEYFLISEKIFHLHEKRKEKNQKKNLPQSESQIYIFFCWGESNLGVMPSLLLSPELLLYLFIYCAAKESSPWVCWITLCDVAVGIKSVACCNSPA